jgi:hypothetical protein
VIGKKKELKQQPNVTAGPARGCSKTVRTDVKKEGMGVPEEDRTVNSVEGTGGRSSRYGGSTAPSSIPTPSGGGRLQLPPGEADIEALRCVTRDWLVPCLVDKFLWVHGVELKHAQKLANRVQSSLLEEGPSVPEGARSEEVRSQVNKKNQYRTLM